MKFKNLQLFAQFLETRDDLATIQYPADPVLEVTEISQRVLTANGPALYFSAPKNSEFPMLTNLFGSERRILWGMGLENIEQLRKLGEALADMREPAQSLQHQSLLQHLPLVKKIMAMTPKQVSGGECQAFVWKGADVDLARLPIQTCWPDDVAPLVTWPLVITRSESKARFNIGIYRQQVLAHNKLIMRWLPHRGGALDYAEWLTRHPEKPFPVSVVIGADPAMILAAVVPIPDGISEYSFAGLFRGEKTVLTQCISNNLSVPCSAEFVLEGHIYPNDAAVEGPYGDHTGYYNEKASFPVFTVECITHRPKPIYLSTHTGRPPDEPSVLGAVMNQLFVPIIKRQFPEIADFHLPPAACSYRMAVVSIKKQYPGHAQRIMMGVWSFLRQFSYTKYVIVVDDDVNVQCWDDVMWAVSTRAEPERDVMIVKNTPIDYLDFASIEAGIGSKMGIDATNKWPGETRREWGTPIIQRADIKRKIDLIWDELGI